MTLFSRSAAVSLALVLTAAAAPVKTSRSPESIARDLGAQKKGAVQRCFEHELKRNPSLSGKATITLELKAPNDVTRVQVRDDLGTPRFTECVRESMRSLDVGAVAEDLTIELPFVFAPQGSDSAESGTPPTSAESRLAIPERKLELAAPVLSQPRPSEPSLSSGFLVLQAISVDEPSTPEPVPSAAAPAAHAPPTPLKTVTMKEVPDQTRCELCHTNDGWKPARFDHSRTGFKLAGKHDKPCETCHLDGWQRSTPGGCATCHLDAHAGEFGTRCGTCHEAAGEDWRSQLRVDAHRRSNFPLVGRHALVPCQECHLQAEDRGYRAGTVACISCHERELNRGILNATDHQRLGASTDCMQCHDSWSFTRARLPMHDQCFPLSGAHAQLRCGQCHTSLTNLRVGGACNTNTAACTTCHQHDCTTMTTQHERIPGFECKDRKCYECHRYLK